MSKIIDLALAREEKAAFTTTSPNCGCKPLCSKRISLNRLCSSLLSPENRARFRAFPEFYCREFGLCLEQIHAVTDLDIVRLLRLGGTPANLKLLLGLFNLDLLDVCCDQTGKSPDEVRQLLG